MIARRGSARCPASPVSQAQATGTELAQLRPYQVGDDVRRSTRRRAPAPAARRAPARPERALTTWLPIDVSPSMAFGTADRLKSDVAQGVALRDRAARLRRAGRVGLLTFGARAPRSRRAAAQRAGRSARRSARASPDGRRGRDALAGGLRRIALTRGHGLVVVVCDCARATANWVARALARSAARHDVLASRSFDPREV